MSNGLGNLAAGDIGQLAVNVNNRLKRIQYRPPALMGSSPGRAHPPTPDRHRHQRAWFPS